MEILVRAESQGRTFLSVCDTLLRLLRVMIMRACCDLSRFKVSAISDHALMDKGTALLSLSLSTFRAILNFVRQDPAHFNGLFGSACEQSQFPNHAGRRAFVRRFPMSF